MVSYTSVLTETGEEKAKRSPCLGITIIVPATLTLPMQLEQNCVPCNKMCTRWALFWRLLLGVGYECLYECRSLFLYFCVLQALSSSLFRFTQ